MDEKKTSLRNKWNTFKENNPTSHIGVLIIFVNLAFILISAGLISILPENRGHSFSEILRLAFTLMVNPSGKYIYSEYPISLIITTVVVLLGMISLTGGTVGFITSIINDFLEKTANSKRPLKLKNHIVILNYNKKVPSIINDYCFDDMKNTFVTILTRENKNKVLNEIDNLYNQKGVGKRFKNIIVREGNPMSKLDLDKLNIKEAKTVIIMSPEYTGAGAASENTAFDLDFEVTKNFMFVSWYFSELNQKSVADIVVETGMSNLEKMVSNYNIESEDQTLVSVNYNEIMGKLLAVTALTPSINGIMEQLFSFEGVEIYIEDAPKGKSIDEELLYNRSVLPLFDKDGKRVYISEDESEFARENKNYVLKKELPKEIIEPKITFEKLEIIIVGNSNKLPYILESLSCFKKKYENDELHVILAGTKDEEKYMKEYYSNPEYKDILLSDKYNYIIVNDIYNPMEELGSYIENKADSVIFLSDDMTNDTHIDEKPLIYWANLKKSIRSNENVDVIVEILDSQNQSIIELKNKDQIVVSDEFLGHFYAQLGKNPDRLDVIKDLITADGDSSSVNLNQELQDEGDLVCASVDMFFGKNKYDLSFDSKRELITWLYEATGKKVITVGLVRDSVPYLFSRTDGDSDSLDSTVLLGIKEGQVCDGIDGKLELRGDDELIMFMVG